MMVMAGAGVVALTIAGLPLDDTADKGPEPIATSDSEDGSMIKTLYVNSKLVDCVGVQPRKCLQVRESPDEEWELFYDDIRGFDFEPGFRYTLRVDVQQIEEPPADASSLQYELVEVVNKTRDERG
jgi:hypothetical protein